MSIFWTILFMYRTGKSEGPHPSHARRRWGHRLSGLASVHFRISVLERQSHKEQMFCTQRVRIFSSSTDVNHHPTTAYFLRHASRSFHHHVNIIKWTYTSHEGSLLPQNRIGWDSPVQVLCPWAECHEEAFGRYASAMRTCWMTWQHFSLL